MLNSTIELILNHRSVRSFEDKTLSGDQIHLLVKSAQAASTSKFIQAYSIIGISDMAIRKQLAEVAGGAEYVHHTGHLFVFVADLHRNKVIAEGKNIDYESLSSTENWLVTVIDASLAAQNMAIAAESMGLGICYIGGIRNDMEKVSQILKTPEYAMPLFGLTVGYPKKIVSQKPRLPVNIIYHKDTYEKNKAEDLYKEYDEEVSQYYRARTKGERINSWRDFIAQVVGSPERAKLSPWLQKKKLAKG